MEDLEVVPNRNREFLKVSSTFWCDAQLLT